LIDGCKVRTGQLRTPKLKTRSRNRRYAAHPAVPDRHTITIQGQRGLNLEGRCLFPSASDPRVATARFQSGLFPGRCILGAFKQLDGASSRSWCRARGQCVFHGLPKLFRNGLICFFSSAKMPVASPRRIDLFHERRRYLPLRCASCPDSSSNVSRILVRTAPLRWRSARPCQPQRSPRNGRAEKIRNLFLFARLRV
jgi:hypothetical protein